MKRISILFMFILTFSMFSPAISIVSDFTLGNYEITNPQEVTTLASTPGVNGSIVKVSDDAGVIDGFPDSNFGGILGDGGNYAGRDGTTNIGRSWLKFNLTHIPRNVHFSRATLNLYLVIEFGTQDYPVGVYYSENDTWVEDEITWNNQPGFDATAADIHDTPASPDMFEVGLWYEWEITAEVIQTLEEDGFLSLLLKQVDESPLNNTAQGFAARDYAVANEVNVAPYIALEYNEPVTSNLAVDGFSESPQIDYIQSSNPEFSWSFSDADQDDFQKNYELQVWNNQDFDGIELMRENNSELMTIHDTDHSGDTNLRPFFTPTEIRFQCKLPSSMISQSGVVDKLYFEVFPSSGIATFYNLSISMLSVEDSAYLGSDFQANYDGRTPIQVLNRTSYSAAIENQYIIFDIENTFIIEENLNLIIEIRHWGYSGTDTLSYVTNTGAGGSVSYKLGAGTYDATTADWVYDRTQGLRLELVSHEVFAESGSSNIFPFGLIVGSSGRFQIKYNQSLVNQEGLIDRILFPVFGFQSVNYRNFSVYLVETPLEGELNHTDLDTNYGGVVPTLVLEDDEYTVQNTGRILVIDVDDVFYYSNTNDLLIEIRFDRLDSGYAAVHRTSNSGGYRAWDWGGGSGDNIGYDMYLDFIYDSTSTVYVGSAFSNSTTYYWRVRTCDNFGIWSQWGTGSFTYEVLESQPEWSGLAESADPIEFGTSVTVSITVTHTTEIQQVLIEYEGGNHTMTQAVDLFSWTWTPTATGASGYTIFMEAYSGVWATTSGSVDVEDTTAPTWIVAPVDQVLDFGEALNYQVNATDLSGITGWAVNDTVNFAVVDGLVTNTTALTAGEYPLLLTVNDTEGNTLNATFTVHVLQSTTTSTTTTTDTGTTDTDTTTPPPGDNTLLLIIIAIGATVVVIIIIVVIKKKS